MTLRQLARLPTRSTAPLPNRSRTVQQRASTLSRCTSCGVAFRSHTRDQQVKSSRSKPQPLSALRRNVRMSASKSSESQPADFDYTHLWVSADGETHIKECKMKGFNLKKYAETEQFVKEVDAPSKLVFSELEPGNFQDWHSCPQVQFVVCLKGSWFVKATDGTKKVFKRGDVLFQDDVKDSPAAKQPTHQSGVVGDEPNQQLIVQVQRKPEVDNPGTL
ncbi:hypothetical protein WJX72_003545 [[Myrmecia] bisecta]|uniref:Cupin 2 conserved barrel domain-containing protein n=1 Tax=[Myrmecia] bisecta TaxID=41462 RepID=A0AAW1Q1G3_9CHLO